MTAPAGAIDQAPAAKAMPVGAPRPYAGLTVVEAIGDDADDALVLAAGMTGRILADLGADVLHLEGRERGFEPSVRLFLGHGKTLIARDGTASTATANIVAAADIAIVDTGRLRRLGREALPPIGAVLSLFGGRLAETDRPAGAFTLAALGGLLGMVGDPAREPLRLGGHQEAYALGLSAYCGLAAALAMPGRQVLPRTIRASLLETIVWLNWKAVPLYGDPDTMPGRAGAAAEWQVLRCADGYAVLVYQEPDWLRLTEALDDPRLLAPRFAMRRDRLANAVELAGLFEQRFMTMTRRDIHALARRHRLPLGPVWDLGEAMRDPHNHARDLFRTLGSSGARAPRLPIGWTTDAARHDAPVDEAAQ